MSSQRKTHSFRSRGLPKRQLCLSEIALAPIHEAKSIACPRVGRVYAGSPLTSAAALPDLERKLRKSLSRFKGWRVFVTDEAARP